MTGHFPGYSVDQLMASQYDKGYTTCQGQQCNRGTQCRYSTFSLKMLYSKCHKKIRDTQSACYENLEMAVEN